MILVLYTCTLHGVSTGSRDDLENLFITYIYVYVCVCVKYKSLKFSLDHTCLEQFHSLNKESSP